MSARRDVIVGPFDRVRSGILPHRRLTGQLDRAAAGTSLALQPGQEETAVEQNIGTWQRVGSVAGGLALSVHGRAASARGGADARHRRRAGPSWHGRATVRSPPRPRLRSSDARHAKRWPARAASTCRRRSPSIGPGTSVFAFWRQLSNLPRFMSHLARVDLLGNGRSHWVASRAAGPPGRVGRRDHQRGRGLPAGVAVAAWRATSTAPGRSVSATCQATRPS